MGVKINFQTIAKEANVSVAYLYKYSELKERIMQLRGQQTHMSVTPRDQPPATPKANSQVVSRLKQRILTLETENNELKRKNEALAGQIYRVHSLLEQVERQKDIIATLEDRLKQATEQITPAKVISLTGKSQTKISETIKAQLEATGIQLNPTLIKAIKSSQEETVLNAIEAYKEAIITGNVGRPLGWLKRAIEEEWKPNGAVQAKSELDTFNEWFPLAKNRGLVKASQNTKQGIMVYTDHGECIAFADMLAKYPVEKLKLSL